MKYVITILTVFAVFNSCSSQDYKAEFNKAFQGKDTLKQKEILTKWEKKDSKNPELYTSYFNYFFSKSRQEFISLTKEQPKSESFSFQDSTGKTAGFIGSQITFDETILRKGLDKIDEGIKLFPNRLDMRFGKIYALGQISDWERFTDEIIKTIQHSAKNKNAWTWTNNEKREGEESFLSSLQNYQLQLYNTGDDNLLKYMRTISNEVLKFYPNNIKNLSNLSITYLLTGEPDKAIEPLLKAEKINPKDVVVLMNIAHAYKLKGDKKKSIEYYEKVIKNADDDRVDYAKKQIEELKK